jgi:endonuclease/exonuclease/phosphatase family metal-dependent hydrolase
MLAKLKKIIHFTVIVFTALVILFYLLACLAPFLNSTNYWFIAMLGLAFPLLCLALLLAIAYWWLKKSRWVYWCIIVFFVGYKQITAVFSFGTNKKFEVAKAPATLRVLTWNLSNWGESNRSGNTNNRSKMIELIKNANTDVLCFQEYLYFKNKSFQDTIVPGLRDIGFKYSYLARSIYTKKVWNSTVFSAVVILSKYPIIDTARFYYSMEENAEPLIYADIQFNNQAIRIFTSHLQSVRLTGDDYDPVDKLKETVTGGIIQTKSIFSKLKKGYERRGLQADIFKATIKESPYPVIVCGDFNDVASSYTYHTIKGNLQDAFLKKGGGFGRTFQYISPTLRIDYILADKKFTINQYHTFKVPFSDHYPVLADIAIGAYILKSTK